MRCLRKVYGESQQCHLCGARGVVGKGHVWGQRVKGGVCRWQCVQECRRGVYGEVVAAGKAQEGSGGRHNREVQKEQGKGK